MTGRAAALAPALAAALALASGAPATAAPAPAPAPTAAAAAAAGDVFAVVIGYNGGQRRLPDLHFADDDAIRFSLLLRGMDTPARRVRVWTLTEIDKQTAAALAGAGLDARPDGPPTRTALADALDQVSRALAARPRGAPAPALYVIYAGHGLQGRVLLQPESGPEAAVTGRELKAAVAALARVAPDLRPFVFVDACRSQSLFAPRGPADEIGPDIAARALSLERAVDDLQIGVVTAAALGRPAAEADKLSAGFFSHVLASGLTGGADVDGDQVVTFKELVAFVTLRTQEITGQQPWFSPPGGGMEAPAFDLHGPHPRLELPVHAQAGRYLIQAASGRPVFAEAFKGAELPLRLVLPAGRYRVVRAESGHVASAAVELHAGEAVDVSQLSFLSQRGAVPPDPSSSPDPTDADAAPADDTGDAALAFSGPFLPGMVTTLVAGYDAGRAPAETTTTTAASAGAPARARNLVGVAAVLAVPPLGVGGAEPGLALSYRRFARRWFAGARLAAGRSTHGAGDGRYQLDRLAALVEAGPAWALGRWLDLTLAAAAGGATIVQRAGGDAPARGDPFAPAAGAGAGLDARVSGNLSVGVQARLLAQWVRLDGARQLFLTPSADVTLAFQF